MRRAILGLDPLGTTEWAISIWRSEGELGNITSNYRKECIQPKTLTTILKRLSNPTNCARETDELQRHLRH